MAATMSMDMSTPPTGSPNTLNQRRHSPAMSIDMDSLPPLVQPSPASNTLIITNLQDPSIFASATLESIRAALAAQAPVHTFSPLKSMRRIICSFYNTEDAITIRSSLDGENVLGNRVRVFFGATTKIELDEDRHLQAPKSDKLFFISPPPSPPMGWEMRDEEPPNKEVHAEDLAEALGKLHARPMADEALHEQNYKKTGNEELSSAGRPDPSRQRSGSVNVVYDPRDGGYSPDLPAIAVEDTSESPGAMTPDGMEGVERKFAHTSRPPVELMEM